MTARWRALVGFGLGAVVAVGCRDGASDGDDPAPPMAALAPAPAPPPSDRSDEKPGFLAVLTPRQSVDVMAPYTSTSAQLLVKLGDQVFEDQVLARLDDHELRQELEAARAQLRTAKAAVEQAKVDRRSARIVLARERAAEAAGVSARADLASAKQAVNKASAMLTVALATAEERATRMDQLRSQLAEMTLLSPIAGRIALLYAEDGARVEAGRPVIRVISADVFVKFAIPADQLGSVKPGDFVDVRLDRRVEPVTARVGHVAPELDAVAQMILADADLVDPPADLQPGTVGRLLPRAPQGNGAARVTQR